MWYFESISKNRAANGRAKLRVAYAWKVVQMTVGKQASAIEIVAQGPELNVRAADRIGNANESHLLVHGVIARALRDGARSPVNLILALSSSVDRWQAPVCAAAA